MKTIAHMDHEGLGSEASISLSVLPGDPGFCRTRGLWRKNSVLTDLLRMFCSSSGSMDRRRSSQPLLDPSRAGLAAVLVLTLDQAQLAPQVLAARSQAAVVLQQLAVLLEEAGRHLMLLLLLLQVAHELLPERRAPLAGQAPEQVWSGLEPVPVRGGDSLFAQQVGDLRLHPQVLVRHPDVLLEHGHRLLGVRTRRQRLRSKRRIRGRSLELLTAQKRIISSFLPMRT